MAKEDNKVGVLVQVPEDIHKTFRLQSVLSGQSMAKRVLEFITEEAKKGFDEGEFKNG